MIGTIIVESTPFAEIPLPPSATRLCVDNQVTRFMLPSSSV